MLLFPIRLHRRRDPLAAVVERFLLPAKATRRGSIARVVRGGRSFQPDPVGTEDPRLGRRRRPRLPGSDRATDRVPLSARALHQRGECLQRHHRLALLRLVRDLPARVGDEPAQQECAEHGAQGDGNQEAQPVCGRGGHYFFRSPATSFEIAAWAASSAAFGDAACRVTEFITVVAGDHTMVISGRFGIGTATST